MSEVKSSDCFKKGFWTTVGVSVGALMGALIIGAGSKASESVVDWASGKVSSIKDSFNSNREG